MVSKGNTRFGYDYCKLGLDILRCISEKEIAIFELFTKVETTLIIY